MVIERFLGFEGVAEEVVVVDLTDLVVEGKGLGLVGVDGDAELQQVDQLPEGWVAQEGNIYWEAGDIRECWF